MKPNPRWLYAWIVLRAALLGPAFLVSVAFAVSGAFGAHGFLKTWLARDLSPLFRGGIIGGLVAWFCWKSLLNTMKAAKGDLALSEADLRSEVVHLGALLAFVIFLALGLKFR